MGFLSVQELYGRVNPSASRIRPSSIMCGGVVRDQRFLNWSTKNRSGVQSLPMNTTKGVWVLKLYVNGTKRSVHLCEL